MPAIDNIQIGQRFGTKTVDGVTVAKDGSRKCLTVCDCGKRGAAWPSELLKGLNATCSTCNGRALAATRPRERHAHKRVGNATPEYRAWCKIRERCEVPSASGYEHYGARGIAMCPEWRASFEAFLSHVGLRPSARHSIDRIDNNGNYEPGNVRWATRVEQARNRRNTVMVMFEGVQRALAELAEIHGIPYKTAWARMSRGWPVEQALSTAVRPMKTSRPTR